MKYFIFILSCFFLTNTYAQKREYYEIKVYHVSTADQVKQVDQFLEKTYLPALHKIGIAKVGVYHHTNIDTAVDKRIFVFIPLRSISQVAEVEDVVIKDATIKSDNYWTTAHNAAPYNRIESILLQSFTLMPKFKAPSLTGAKTERIYELRSYESATERLYRKKVEMFNQGGEIALFNRLQFNAVFYGEVLAGSRMPNLMYITSFNNKKERDEHWAAFVADPEWKKLSAMEEYKNTVSRNDTMLLNPTEFSEL